MSKFIILIIYATIGYVTATLRLELCKSRRQQILRDEALLALGGNVQLNDAEEAVNNCLMRRKFQEIHYSFDHPEFLNFSHHYYSYKNQIQYSKVYQIIKQMPKGAALHVHDMALLGPEYLLNITYINQLYVCFEKTQLKLLFSRTKPNKTCAGHWQLMSVARNNAKNVTEFDNNIRKHFTVVTEDPSNFYTDINKIWQVFRNYFSTVMPLLTYRPVWEQYFYDALETFRNDKIMYVEVRTILPNLYELDGTVFDQLITAKAYKKALTLFKKDYPDFIGAKIIYAPSRLVNSYTVENYITVAKEVKTNLPELFAGFDLVGQEDLGGPLIEFLPELVSASDDLDYYFHAGETNWYGTMTDDNLVDAIVLGTKRIGHAFALDKHPILMDEVKEKGIGLEVNVISNSVLSLVRDVRNHPLATFLAKGMPVVITSDDPGAWEAEPLSHDFYVAFQGVASRLADLRLLKTLALNSFLYSALKDHEKVDALERFHLAWDSFIDNFTCSSV